MQTPICTPAGNSPWTAVSYVLLFLFLAMAASPAVTKAGQEPEVETTVRYLIRHVEESGLVFVRNSSRYTSAEAAEHLQRKYRHFHEKIDTPGDFIALCATRSLVTGKPYQVISHQGQETMVSEWLNEALEEYRNNAAKAL